jgi:hypothetical protein
MTWEIIRASGLVAYALLAASVVWGLLVSSKLLGRAVSAKALTYTHEGLAVAGVLATITHAGFLLADRYVDFDAAAVLIPGASSWNPAAVAMGVVAMWVTVVVTFSFYVRKWIGQKAWRAIHFGSLGAFVAALAHGVAAGTDTANPAVLVLYGVTGGAVAALLVARVALAGSPARRAVPPAAVTSAPAAAGREA